MLTVAQTTLSMKGLHPSRRSVLGAAAALAAGARPRPGTAAVTSAAAEGGSVDGLNVDPSATLVDTSQDYDISRAVLYDTASGSFLPAAPERSLKPALRRAADGAGEDIRVLFAGEEPTHPLHHRMQLEMVKAVDAMDDRPVAIGLEMFYRAHQPALDAFVFEDGSFAALKRRTKWRSTWGYDFNHYSKILAYARQHGIRLVGLNVPFGFVSAVANNGLDGLPASLKPYMPTIDRGNERHFARFERDVRLVPGGPAVDGTTLAHWYEAELLWEEYMAQSIAGYVQQHEGRIVVLAGASRVRAKDGVPDRVTRRTGGATFTVLPLTVPWATTGMPAITQPLGASEADWLLYTQAEISHEPRRISPFGPRVLQESPRVSPVALRLGTSSAPLTEA